MLLKLFEVRIDAGLEADGFTDANFNADAVHNALVRKYVYARMDGFQVTDKTELYSRLAAVDGRSGDVERDGRRLLEASLAMLLEVRELAATEGVGPELARAADALERVVAGVRNGPLGMPANAAAPPIGDLDVGD